MSADRRTYAWVGAAVVCAGCGTGPLDAVALAPRTLGSGLWAHYTFDETSGDVAHDSSGNGRDGRTFGTSWTGDGRFGGAISIGDGGYVEIDNFPNATPSWTVSAWARVSAINAAEPIITIVSTLSAFQSGGWELNWMPPTVFQFGSVGSGIAGVVPPGYQSIEAIGVVDGAWNHVVAVVDSDAASSRLYVNGYEGAETPDVSPIAASSTTMYFGRWAYPGRQLIGDLDDISIFDRALTDPEVGSLFDSPPPNPQ